MPIGRPHGLRPVRAPARLHGHSPLLGSGGAWNLGKGLILKVSADCGLHPLCLDTRTGGERRLRTMDRR